MIRRSTAVLLILAFLFGLPAKAWAPGNCAVFSTYTLNDTVTAANLNSNFTQAAVTNSTPACLDDASGSASAMQSQVSPWQGDTESLPTTLTGELERLRYVLHVMLGMDGGYWYRVDSNIDFATGAGIDGSGVGRHVTAVGLHTWGGSQRFPAITSTLRHTTGIFWPAAHHMAISVDPAVDRDKAGVELLRIHAAGVVFHHTAAIMFRHSTGGMNADQYGHITAIQVSRGLVSVAGNEAAGRDTLIFGHAGAVTQIVGYGASHIALGSGAYIALGRHVGTLTGATPVKNALYADTIIKAWVNFDGSITAAPISAGFGVSGVTKNGVGDYTVTWISALAAQHSAVAMNSRSTANNTVITSIEQTSASASTMRVIFSTTAGSAVDCVECMVMLLGRQ